MVGAVHVPPPRRRPGGRTARTRAQVLDAVLAELGEHGYDGLTMEAVAARAGVHRAAALGGPLRPVRGRRHPSRPTR
ncbi:TetR family transcriptional regulator [Actinomadura sp. K4S16]|uniref:TetR family transcriptional regulator n=1 Tax=Actinomadura sp. K4S16 TaxID=1316147 RepID=UPI0035D0012F